MLNLTYSKSPRIIADFSSGDGALLIEAKSKWPNAHIVANDICQFSLRIVRDKIHNPQLYCIDFFDHLEHTLNSTLSALRNKCDIILSNPPYSYRGITKFEDFDSKTNFQCPKSLIFILHSIKYLKKNGQLIALLPHGALHGTRSFEAIQYLKHYCNISEHTIYNEKTFKKCSATTQLVSITKRNVNHTFEIKKNTFTNTLSIQRGNTTPNHKNKSNGFNLIHSTSLKENGIVPEKNKFGDEKSKTIASPSIIIQRVGKIKKHKIGLYSGKDTVSISDCILAIPVKTTKDGNIIIEKIHNNWDEFVNLYTGTCAKHISIQKLHDFITTIE